MKLSVVIPVYNEVENLQLLHEAIHQALKSVKYSWEMILVDDGSTDKSPEELEKLARKDPRYVRVVLLRRNFGQTTAIAAGIDQALGEIIVMMDADLQNDPIDIPAMIVKIDEGYDVVSGWRFNRKDKFSKRFFSLIINKLRRKMIGDRLHDYGCSLKIYKRECIKDIINYRTWKY